MKLTKNTYTKVKPGVTLIELTVVILVLLTLIGVLFIGAQIYKRGADRSACILNIRNIQLAVRSNQNLNEGIAVGDTIDFTNTIFDIATTDSSGNTTITTPNFLTRPLCPLTPSTDPGYALQTTYPNSGVVIATCIPNGVNGNSSENVLDHFPTNTSGW